MLVTSGLSRLECRVKPLRDEDRRTLELYDRLFEQPGVELIDIGSGVIDGATAIRARYGFKTPDCIHIASAVEAGVTHFLTGDRALARFEGLSVRTVVASD